VEVVAGLVEYVTDTADFDYDGDVADIDLNA